MVATIVSILLSALGVTMGLEGLKKQFATWYAGQSLLVRKALPWLAALLIVLAVRAFTLPQSFTGVVWFVLTVAAVAVVAQGWFAVLQRIGPAASAAQ